MTCTKCGYTEDADAVYCSSCGALLGSAAEPASQATPPASGTAQSGSQATPPASGSAGPVPGLGGPTASRGLTGGPAGARTWTANSPTTQNRSSSVYGALVIILGAICFLITLILQFVKLSADGSSLSASQINGICQSNLGQFGQAVSGLFGDNQPQSLCSTAATIEDWKGITFWFGLALVLSGIGLIARSRDSWLRSSMATYAASQQSPAAKLAAAARAEANAARLRAQAAQMQGRQAAAPGQQPETPVQQSSVPGQQPPAPPAQGLARPQAGFDAAEP
jgi:hypothetical protein